MPSSSVSGENGLQGMTPDHERQKRKEKDSLVSFPMGRKYLREKPGKNFNPQDQKYAKV